MSELAKVCDCVINDKEYKADSTKRKLLYSKVLNVEKRMFDIYLKTGKSKKDNFPFESLGKILYASHDETIKIARALFNARWKPEVHVTLVRKRFEKVSYIGKSVTF